MKAISIEELKTIQIEILKGIDWFCKKNNITYFLTAGTLIGAVRHKGFIPWDDDIDIMMLREDYDKFIYSFNGSVGNLVVDAPELNWNCYAPYANVYDNRTVLIEKGKTHRNVELGVKIDVFPFDALPSNELLYTLTRKIVLLLNSIMRVKNLTVPYSQLSKKHRFIKCFLSWFPYKLAQKIIHRIAVSNRVDQDADVFLRVFDITKPMRARKKIFEEVSYVPFEQYKFPIPKLADEYLKIRYGDYMQLPPEEDRVPHHNFRAYWKQR